MWFSNICSEREGKQKNGISYGSMHFLGYPKGTRGGLFYDLIDNKMLMETNVTFLE